MYHLTVENMNEEQLGITDNETKFILTSITGLNPPSSNIATSVIAGMDGALFNSAKMEERNIVFTVKILGDIETNRQLLYQYIKSKSYLKLYIESENRAVYIDGYVETIECDIFTNFETMQVSILCPDPMFKDQKTSLVNATNITGAFTFPFSIELGHPIPFGSVSLDYVKSVNNDGDDSGLEIIMRAVGPCRNPRVYNLSTNEEMSFKLLMNRGDKLWINTNKGHKKILFNDDTNALKWLQFGSKWLSLKDGVNYISYRADEGVDALNIMFLYEKKYQGV